MRATFRVQGITDETTTCECCGRVDLKRTVRLVELDADGNDLDAVYYGTGCAAKAAGTTSYQIRTAAGVADNLADAAARWAREALDIFPGLPVAEYMAANPFFAGRQADALISLTETIAEARQIAETGDLVGTRFERRLRKLPTVTAAKPARPAAPAAPAARPAAVSTVSAAQGTLF